MRRAAGRKGERGVALIIVLGFLGLMLMMAVAFMTQARVERLVSDSSTEAMRARQIAQTGIAAGIQDYVNAIQQLKSQSEDEHDIFLSGDLNTGQYSYGKETYGTTNLWRGKVKDWVWDWHKEGTGDDNVRNMQWIWVGEEPVEDQGHVEGDTQDKERPFQAVPAAIGTCAALSAIAPDHQP